MSAQQQHRKVGDHSVAFYHSTDDTDTVMSPINITRDIHGLSRPSFRQPIDQQSRSSQSAREFGANHDIGYASFIQWRSCLTPGTSSTGLTAEAVPEFIELTSKLDEHRHHEAIAAAAVDRSGHNLHDAW